MDKTEISKYLGIAIVTMLLSSGAVVLLNDDSTVYSCESKGIVSDCINGVKADSLRCYYDADDGRAYSYCKEGWKENFITQEQPNEPTETIKDARGNSYKCNTQGCQI